MLQSLIDALESTHKEGLLKGAITLFGERGYKGVTARDLATEAGCATGSIYRLYRSKLNLYVAALKDVTTRAEADLGKIIVSLYKEQKNHDVRHFIAEASKRWYAMLAQDDARCIQQVLIGDPKRRELALGPVGQIITTLAAALDDKTKAKSNADANETVETLVWRLFQYKVSRPTAQSSKEEMEKVQDIIDNWLDLAISKTSR